MRRRTEPIPRPSVRGERRCVRRGSRVWVARISRHCRVSGCIPKVDQRGKAEEVVG
jgi:hypothetical protein